MDMVKVRQERETCERELPSVACVSRRHNGVPLERVCKGQAALSSRLSMTWIMTMRMSASLLDGCSS